VCSSDLDFIGKKVVEHHLVVADPIIVEFGEKFYHFNSGDRKRIENHPAIMPEELVRRHIQSWSIEGDIVYDPFSGSGTTSKVAYEMGRTYLGSEINKEYYEASIEIVKQSTQYKQFFK
jgi:DNA modification methylase